MANTKLTFNETTYEFHYYEPNGKPAYNLYKNGIPSQYNLIYDVDGDMEGFNLYVDGSNEYHKTLLSQLWMGLPHSIDNSYEFTLRKVLEIFNEIQIKTGTYNF